MTTNSNRFVFGAVALATLGICVTATPAAAQPVAPVQATDAPTHAEVTFAIFSAPGTYVVRAMADDGHLSVPLDITVSVTEGP